jgi:dipeptidyl aminopeptidase/acylaminoacyl peptidase
MKTQLHPRFTDYCMQVVSVRSLALIFALLVIVLSLPLVASSTAAADKHPFGVDDYSALHSARALAVSPDGKSVLYVISYDGDKGPTKHEWHTIDVTGANDRKLDLPETFQPDGFTKDGQALYGAYEVNKKRQLAIVPLQGTATQIISLPRGIRGHWISPDGNRFVLTADPRPPDSLDEVRHVAENEVNSLYVSDAHGPQGAWWCPELKDVTDVAWSADSTQLAVVTQYQKIGHHDVRAFLWVCGASGARKVADIPNSVSGIAWADGGKNLAFATTTTDVLTPDHLSTVSAAGGTPQDQTPKLEASITTVSNDPRGTVWVEMHKGTITEVYAWRDSKLTPEYRWPGGIVNGLPVLSPFAASPEVLAFTVGDPTHSSNVAVLNGTELQRITHQGDDTLAHVALGDVRVVNWTSKDGIKLEGIATFPADYQPGKKYKFLVLPHGGPEANDTLRFDFLSRLIAGWGYVVLQPEYRGSTGYGSQFLQAIYQHFGDLAYRDVDSASDYAIDQGWADPNRQAMFGWSAGGFMASWTVTQTHRYKAAVEGAGITDWLSFIPTSDISQVDYDNRLQEKSPQPFLQFSAVMYADQVTTPLLILHGESDVRVPTFQGREFFVLLAERGKTVRMVTYPGSPHFPVLAEQRRDVFQEIRNWLDKYNP